MRALLAALVLVGCASPHGIVVESDTEPVRLEGDYGPPCAVRVELDGHVYTFASSLGCYVVRAEVHVPDYDELGLQWRP